MKLNINKKLYNLIILIKENWKKLMKSDELEDEKFFTTKEDFFHRSVK